MVRHLIGPFEHLLEGVEQPKHVHRCQLRRTRIHWFCRTPGEGVAIEPRSVAELGRRVLVLLVLEQPTHQIGARIGVEQLAVFAILHRGIGGQEHLRLDVDERRGDDQILADHVDVQRAHQLQVLEVLLGDEAHRNVQDVELVLANEVQQQVERSLEPFELELVRVGVVVRGLRSGLRARVLLSVGPSHGKRVVAVW